MTVPTASPEPLPSVALYGVPASQRPALVYLARLSGGSRRTMRGALDLIARELMDGNPGEPCDAETLNWGALRYTHTAAIRRRLIEREYAPATANKMLAALRGVLREAWKLGHMTAEDFHRAVELEPVRGTVEPRGRALNQVEVIALFKECESDDTASGVRDAAMIALLYGAGLRRSELVGLNVSDYDAPSGALRVRGKGRKARTVYVTHGSREALEAWLSHARIGIDASTKPLFVPIDKAGRLQPRRMTDQALYYALRRRAKAAGIKEFSPHDLRRTFIGDMLDAGADISAVQQLAGHSNISTTARYDRRGERAKKKAMSLLLVPYTSKQSRRH